MPGTMYVFAAAPPEGLLQNILASGVPAGRKHRVKTGKGAPVYITLVDPFVVKEEDTSSFEMRVARLQKWAGSQASFFIELSNRYFFNQRPMPVVFADALNRRHFGDLHPAFFRELNKYVNTGNLFYPYQAHMDIDHKYVAPDGSQEYHSSSFVCNTFYLWKYTGAGWQMCREFRLSGRLEQLSLF